MNKKLCSKVTEGEIIAFNYRGMELPAIITVQYEINNTKYTLKESVKLKSSLIKLGPIPIGQRKTPKISTRIGDKLKINYNPEIPSNAYITENTGIINC